MNSITVLIIVALLLVVGKALYQFLPKKVPPESRDPNINYAELEAAEQALKAQGEKDWVVLKRCAGPAYNHTAMTALVSALGAEGVEATYDVIASSSADAGVTNFMLKVIRGDEEKAIEILSRLEK